MSKIVRMVVANFLYDVNILNTNLNTTFRVQYNFVYQFHQLHVNVFHIFKIKQQDGTL